MPGVDAPPPAPPTVEQLAAANQEQTTAIRQLFTMLQPMLAWFTAQQTAAAHPPVIPTAAPAPNPGPGVATAVEKSKLKKIDGKAALGAPCWTVSSLSSSFRPARSFSPSPRRLTCQRG